MWKSLDKTYWIKKKNLYLLNDGSGDKKKQKAQNSVSWK